MTAYRNVRTTEGGCDEVIEKLDFAKLRSGVSNELDFPGPLNGGHEGIDYMDPSFFPIAIAKRFIPLLVAR